MKKKLKTTTKHIATNHVHLNEIRKRIGHLVKGRIRIMIKVLNYRIKWMLHAREDFPESHRNQKTLHKVVEEQDLTPGKLYTWA